MSEKNIPNPEKPKAKETKPPRTPDPRTVRELGKTAVGDKKGR